MQKNKLIPIVDSFSQKKMGVIGDLMLDEFISGSVERISPEAPIPVVSVNKEHFMPGGAANTANNIASLGGKVFLVGLVGADQAKDTLLALLKQSNINVDGVIVASGQPTIQKTRVVAMGQQIVRLDREKISYISKKIEKKALEFISKNITHWDGVVISDYGKGFITESLAKEVIRLAKKYNKPVIADTKKNSHAPFFKGVTLMKPNLHEAKNMTGLQDLNQIGQAIQKSLHCDVLVTQGAQGMTLFEKNTVKHFPAKAREVFDVSGAGDTVLAVVSLALCSGANLKEAAIIANHAAGISVAKVGTAVVLPEELKKDLDGNE